MGHGKQKKNGKQASGTFAHPNTVTAEEWKHIITEALVEADNKKAEMLKVKNEEDHKMWQDAVGIKDYSKEKFLKKWILTFFNELIVLIKLSFIPREKVRGDRVTFTLLQLSARFCFFIADISLLVIAFYCFFIHPFILAAYITPSLLWSNIFLSFSWGFLAFVFSRLFHMASLEVENIEDRNYLFGLISSITALVSLVLSIVAIIK